MTDREQSRRDEFADDVLERLIASNQDYQRSHGHYIVPLAQRLLDTRAELEQAERERDETWESLCRSKETELRHERQLAAVPPLVEALKRVEHYPYAVTADAQSDLRAVKDIAREALAAWEKP